MLGGLSRGGRRCRRCRPRRADVWIRSDVPARILPERDDAGHRFQEVLGVGGVGVHRAGVVDSLATLHLSILVEGTGSRLTRFIGTAEPPEVRTENVELRIL